MSPLDEFRARWIANAPPLPPFVDVINVAVTTDTLPDTWGSALLTVTARVDASLGSQPHVDETGEIVAALFARSGTGSSPLDAAVVALRDTFHGYMTADNQLQFRGVVGPQDIDPMADGEWWRLAFVVPFVVWSRRTEPVPVTSAADWRGTPNV
jgi:hypothetical protein